jgi:hypothetical protein
MSTLEGEHSTHEILEGFDLEIQNDGITCQRIYEGLWPQIMRDVPRIGTRLADLAIAPPFPYLPNIYLYVDKQKFSRKYPEHAICAITASIRFPGGMSSQDPDAQGDTEQPQYSIQAGSQTLPLEAHKSFHQDSAFGVKITDECDLDPETYPDLKKLSTPLESKWEGTIGSLIQMIKSSTINDRAIIYDTLTNSQSQALDLIKYFFKKYDAGTQSFTALLPVARISYVARKMPYIDGHARIETPPNFPNLPAGFQWLKNDISSETTGRYGRWTNNTAYAGAEQWDTDLYPPAG